MFKNEADLKKTVSRLNIDNKPNPAHREGLRREMLSAFDETSQQLQERRTLHSVLRRTIMRNPITKIAAAAAIIIVAILVLHNGSVDMAAPAFGVQDVLNALKKTEWVHCVVKVEQTNADAETADRMDMVGGSGWECWESVHPARSFEKHDNGGIYSAENDTGRRLGYDPKTNKISIVYKDPASSQENYDSIADMYTKQIAEVEKAGGEVRYEEGVHDGRPVHVLSVDFTSDEGLHSMFSVIIDPETYLPRKYTAQQTNSKKGLHSAFSGTFDYPDTGPEDIYALGVPRTAEIVEQN
jgi:hypothetical protein